MSRAWPVILIAVSLTTGLDAAARERPGAAVVVTLRDGRTTGGELYAVKTNEIIVVDARGANEVVAVADIKWIDLRKSIRRTVKTGAILGFGAGALVGIGAVAADDHGTLGLGGYAAAAGLVGLLGAVPGALAGWAIASPNRNVVFAIESLSGEPLRKALSKMRKLARVPSLR